METFSITFGECAENNVGMQMIGNIAQDPLTVEDFDECIKQFGLVENGGACELHNISYNNNSAYLFIIRNGVNSLGENKDHIFNELKKLPVDKHALFRGKVMNKNARWNNCFGDFSQKSDIINYGKGTVIHFKDSPLVGLRKKIEIFGPKTKNLNAELNYYYDINKCGIGFHGDTERKIVVCARFGASLKMAFQWYDYDKENKVKAVGNKFTTILNGGDIYAMTNNRFGIGRKKVHT